MYIETVRNRNSPPCVLLRESYRENGKVKKRTLSNLTHWPSELVEHFKILLAGGIAVPNLEESFEIVRSLPHGHVAAVLGTIHRLGLHRILGARRSRERDLCEAMIAARILEPQSKLAAARGFGAETASNTLGECLDIESADANELYAAMDWLLERQESIEKELVKNHLKDGALMLYDVSSTYFEGRCCPLARYGHSKDGKKDKLQIVFGVLCTAEGIPVAVEVFDGNTKDCMTLESQIRKIRDRFGIQRIAWVGDRGMITEARIREEMRGVEGLDWITALTAPAIRGLVETGCFQPSLFDEWGVAELQSPEYPGERLIACKNPFLADERARKREDLLQATERELDKIAAAAARPNRPLRGQDRIGMRVGKVLGRFKVGKHFIVTIEDDRFHYQRNGERIQNEAALDGIYIVRTSLPAEISSAEETVRSYKRLSKVERIFRSLKSIDLHIRPIFHWADRRVRAHAFLCVLAEYVAWHMREALAPILFEDDDPQAGERLRESIVAPAQRSPKAIRKIRTRRTEDGLPVHSFQTLLRDLATIVQNRYHFKQQKLPAFNKTTTPTPLQQRAFELLRISM